MAAFANLTFEIVDHQNERSRVKFRVPAVNDTGTNWASDFITPVTSVKAVLHSKLAAVTDCNFGNVTEEQSIEINVPSVPASVQAVNANVIRLQLFDSTTGRKSRIDIPGPKSALIPSGTDDVDLTLADLAALVTAIEGGCVSIDGNAITVLKGTYVSRRDKR